DGGWGYRSKDQKSYGSMTCAGLTGLAITLGRLGVADPAKDERVKRGLDWLAAHWTLDANPESQKNGAEARQLYYLYGLERVGVLLGTDFLGDHEWYPEGAKWLVEHQRPDGSWRVRESDMLDTSYAMLFLTRATTPLALPKGGSGTLRTEVLVPGEV